MRIHFHFSPYLMIRRFAWWTATRAAPTTFAKIVLALCAAAGTMLAPRQAQTAPPPPSLPHNVYGQLFLDGAATTGAALTAETNGVTFTSTTLTSGGLSGVFSFVVPADSPETPASDGGAAGSHVSFSTPDYEIKETFPWQPGGSTLLNLTTDPFTHTLTYDFDLAPAYTFPGHGKDPALAITSTGALSPGFTQVQIRANQACTNDPTDVTVQRCFSITAERPSGLVTSLKLYFYRSQIPVGLFCESLSVFHYQSGIWQPEDVADRNCSSNPYWVQVDGVTGFSTFVLKAAPEEPSPVRLLFLRAHSGWNWWEWLEQILGLARLW